jgi:hypothetical protein
MRSDFGTNVRELLAGPRASIMVRLSRTLLRVDKDRSRNHRHGRANECFRPHELIC